MGEISLGVSDDSLKCFSIYVFEYFMQASLASYLY